MRTAETTEVADDLPLETIQAILRAHSVRLAILFGSHASGKAHAASDIDIAVELDEIQHDDSEYNEAFFGLSADLSEKLGTDDVDIVDVDTLTPRVAKSVFDDGILLVGELERAEKVRRDLTETAEAEQSPRERFDSALAKIDEHLSGSAGTKTDGTDIFR